MPLSHGGWIIMRFAGPRITKRKHKKTQKKQKKKKKEKKNQKKKKTPKKNNTRGE